MIAVFRDRVILASRVLLAHPWNENVVNLEGSQLAYGLFVNLTFYWQRKFEVEGTVTLCNIEVDT